MVYIVLCTLAVFTKPTIREREKDEVIRDAMTPVTSKGIVSYGSYKSGEWKVQDLNVRPLQQGEVLVEMVAAGICHTDLHFAGAEEGFGIHYPRVMGHEGAFYPFACVHAPASELTAVCRSRVCSRGWTRCHSSKER